jgi:hypothetical protein
MKETHGEIPPYGYRWYLRIDRTLTEEKPAADTAGKEDTPEKKKTAPKKAKTALKKDSTKEVSKKAKAALKKDSAKKKTPKKTGKAAAGKEAPADAEQGADGMEE